MPGAVLSSLAVNKHFLGHSCCISNSSQIILTLCAYIARISDLKEMKRRSQTIPTHAQWCLLWAHWLLPSSSEFKGQSDFLLRSVTFNGPMSRRCPDSVCVTVKSNVVVNLKHCWAAAMFVVFESDKRVHCSLLHCVCAHVRVYGWLHSLHSTVIDMSVRHCPANEMTSLIDRALTRLSTGPNKVNMRLTSHMPNLSQQTLNPQNQTTRGRKKAAHF